MHNFKPTTTLLLALILSLSLSAQHPYYEKTYQPSQLKSDLASFRNTLETVHAGLYWYTPKEEIDALFNEAAQNINQALSEREFYQIIASINAKVNCGHTGTIASPDGRKSLDKRFPFEFQYLENQVYLIEDYTEKNQPFQVVKKINQVPIFTIIDQISALRGTDGFIQSPHPIIVNNSASFSYWYHLLYADSTYTLELANGQVIKRTAISPAALKAYRKSSNATETIRDSLLSGSQTAILSINSFEKDALNSGPIRYKKYLAQFFKTLKKQGIKNLIIDLSTNGGGEDNYASLLYRYLTDQDFIYYRSMECNPVPYEGLGENVYLPTEVTNGLIRKIFIKKRQERYFVKPTFRTKGLRKQKSKNNHFVGNLYFLVGGKTYSASAEIAAYAQAHRPNTYFIGQEVGGAIAGNTSALSAYTVLENTRIAAYIPLIRYTMNIDNPTFGRGVQPDFPIVPSLRAFQEGKHESLDKALELIKNGH